MFTSRLRLETALGHGEPDRIPFDLGSTKMTGINMGAYTNLLSYKKWSRFDERPQILDPVQQLAMVSGRVLEELKVDTRGLLPLSPLSFKTAYHIEGGYRAFFDEWGIQWKMPISDGKYFDVTSHPMEGDFSLPDLDDYPWPDSSDDSRTRDFSREIYNLKAVDDYAFVLHGMTSGVLEMALRLRGFEQFFLDMALDPGFAGALLDRIVDIKCAYWERALGKYGDDVLVAVEADDLGIQNSLMISPQMYRSILKPRHKRLFSFIKKTAPHVKVFLHSCGAIKPLIPDLIEIGTDILNPVQVSAAGMDTKSLKREFGKDLVFWGGGVDSQNTLPFGTPHDVREEVKRRIDDLAPGGGFVFSPIHNIQGDVPPQNIDAMLETLYICGTY